MARLPVPVAACRNAVRQAVDEICAEHGTGGLILVACSGGADSLALAVASAFVAPRRDLRVGLVTVDHGLQDGSAERAARLASWAQEYGFEPVEAVTVEVDRRAVGMEAGARESRYSALAAAAERHGAIAVFLGHTLNDQAETVLLALSRGAGPRGIAGMPYSRLGDPAFGKANHAIPAAEKASWSYYRPFLHVSRAETSDACAELGLVPWQDPHNTDPAYRRARVRALLPQLEETLGPGLVANLARTAHLVAADVRELDRSAARAMGEVIDGENAVRAARLADQPTAIRTRILHAWVKTLGVSWSAVSSKHIDSLDALVMAWAGQGPVSLPGGVSVRRVGGRLMAAERS